MTDRLTERRAERGSCWGDFCATGRSEKQQSNNNKGQECSLFEWEKGFEIYLKTIRAIFRIVYGSKKINIVKKRGYISKITDEISLKIWSKVPPKCPAHKNRNKPITLRFSF